MKKYLFYLLLLLSFSLSYAQKDTDKLKGTIRTTYFVLDLNSPSESSFQKSNKDGKLSIKSNELLAFKLKNGNPFKYKYVINHRLVDLFEDASYNPYDSISQSAFAKSINPIPTTSEIQAYDGQNDFSNKCLQAKRIIINNSRIAGELFIKSLEGVKTEEAQLNIINALTIVSYKMSQVESNIKSYMSLISNEDFLDKDEFKMNRDSYKTRYEEILTDLVLLNSDALNFEIIKDEYLKKRGSISDSSKKTEKILERLLQVKLNNYLLPIDISGRNIDLVEITLERHSKGDNGGKLDEYSYDIWIEGGVKIDISAGTFITSLYDEEFFTTDYSDATTDANKLIHNKDKGDYDFGFGSMVNITYRTRSWIKPNLSFGALFTTNQKFQVLSGLGLTIGKEERIILHGGIAMGVVERLSGNLIADGITPYDLGANGQVTTDSKFEFGHFFGITYNLGKTRRKSN